MKTVIPAGIKLKYLQSKPKKFMQNYEHSLLEYITYKNLITSTKFGRNYSEDVEESWNSSPNEQLEVDFIQTLLNFIKDRKEELFKIHCLFPLNLHYSLKDKFQENNLNAEEISKESLRAVEENKELREATKKEFYGYNKKNSILLSKAKKLGYHVTIDEEITFVKMEATDEPSLDLSNTKATEKLVYLNELGILEFLRNKQPFNFSINKLASVLSAITDEKTTTLQPVLNAMLSGHTSTPQKDPYNSTRTVPTVKSKLTDLGYNVEK